MRAKWRVALILFAVCLFSNAVTAQSVAVQFLNGHSGKPIHKGERVYVSFASTAGPQLLDLRTDGQGEIQFDAKGAKTFQVVAVGYIPCGEQPIGSARKDYSIDAVMKGGLLTTNNCGHLNAEPLQGRLQYFVRPATWWELFKE